MQLFVANLPAEALASSLGLVETDRLDPSRSHQAAGLPVNTSIMRPAARPSHSSGIL